MPRDRYRVADGSGRRRVLASRPVIGARNTDGFYLRIQEALMGTWRLYTGSDGQSHVEKIDYKAQADWVKGIPTTQITFSEWHVGRFYDWHPAPRRQFVIILSGQLEIGCGDGSKHVFGPGDARLVEDTTGKGHTTRQLGNEPCVTATIPLANQ